MKKIRIAGVPEHFNYPWLLAIEQGLFEQAGIELLWRNVPEGTGKLCEDLRNKETDIAVILTEGIIKDILAGNPSTIVQIYVESPLIWGIHVATPSPYWEIADLENRIAAISRPGSGSQLMAYVNAAQQGWKRKLQFKIVDTLDEAVKALCQESADYLLWEHFMTKKLVDEGILRRLGDCLTPWPSFVIAVRNELLANEKESIERILKVINKTTQTFKTVSHLDQTLASIYNQKIEDIQEWLKLTTWSQKLLDENQFNQIQNQLFQFKILIK